MGTTLKIFKKSFLINASKFLCGFVIGGVFSFLAQRIGSTSNEETVVENDYPQVYGVDVSFWQGSIQWDQLALPCDDAGFVSGKIPAPRKHRPVQFAFIRVAKGHSIVDSLYQSYYNEAKNNVFLVEPITF